MMGRWQRLVYFARRADGTGPIKIGCSSCPSTRVKQLGFDHAERFIILAITKGDLSAERWLHRRFADSRATVPMKRSGRASPISGWREWFEPTDELLLLIDDLNAGRLELPTVDDRDERMASQYLSGSTLEAVGCEFGMTRERVRQILSEHGYPTNPAARSRYLAEQMDAAA